MLKIMAGTLLALMSVAMLLLGCTTTGLSEISTISDNSASPPTSTAGPELDGHFDLSEIPQAL